MGLYQIFFAILLGCISGCGGGDAASAPVPFTVIDTDSFSGVTRLRTVVVRDPASWAALWAEHKSTRIPPPALPQVDFSNQRVIAVFLGERPDLCYSVAIAGIAQTASNIVVTYHENVPGGGSCPQLVGKPTQIATTARFDQEVVFVRQ
ncbi:MAG: hypothetical protein HYX47_13750 [Burkholderiales bacterium]|nr:hypothetical protein [Burkholderiales bacterium]